MFFLISLINIDNRFLTTVVACHQQECYSDTQLPSTHEAAAAPTPAAKRNPERTGEQREDHQSNISLTH